jgi:hypothetical protein
MIPRVVPRVRLLYVQGLDGAHDELRKPREVELTTDGELLIVSTPFAGRPLVKLPVAAVERVVVEPAAGPTTAANKVGAGLTGTEEVIVLQFQAARGVPPAVAGQPLVFAALHGGNVAKLLGAVKALLLPRTPEQMARLKQGERRLDRYYAIGLVALVILVVALFIAIYQLLVPPKPREAFVGGGLPAASSLPAAWAG